MRKVRTFAALAALTALLAGAPATATHNIPRDLSIKYSAKKHRFKGKLKSQVGDCRAGLVVLAAPKNVADSIINKDDKEKK